MPKLSPAIDVPIAGRTVLLGVAAGLRTQLPLALVSARVSRRDPSDTDDWPLHLFRSRFVRLGFAMTAIGELIADKTPFVPDRIEPGPLAGRLVFGGLAGALFAHLHDRPAPLGFALGAAGARAGAYAGYHARIALARDTALPDPVWAVAEDLLAFTLTRLALRE